MIRDIALAYGDDPILRQRLRPHQVRALEDIATCGTAALGVHVERCDHCGDTRLKPNTCGNRACPHCQGKERAEWVLARMNELLPCGYFHAVLTLPPALRTIAQVHQAVVLRCLIQAACDAIQRLCRDPRHLGGEVGLLALLHTWRRDLGWHPHVHLLVTAGAWDSKHQRWIPAKHYGRQRRAFLLPAQLLGACFQRRLRRLLLDAYDDGDFEDAALPELASRSNLARLLAQTLTKPAVLRIEPPFAGPQTLLKYLGAYINRSAISPKRIRNFDSDAGTVTYTWSTNAQPDITRTATINAVDFLLRFAQHLLPPGIQRIRYRGLWHPSQRTTTLQAARHALQASRPTTESQPPPLTTPTPTNITGDPCPQCGIGRYQRIPGPHQRPSRHARRTWLATIRAEIRNQTPENTYILA